MKKIRKVLFPAPLFVMLVVLFYELMLHIWITEQILPGRMAAVLLCAMGLGLTLGFVTSLFPAKAQKWVACIFTVLLAVLYLMEYFLNDAYQNFMTFETIFAGAEGVATDYLGLILSLLLHEWWRIAICLLPMVAYALFTRTGKCCWKVRTILAAGAATVYMLGFITIQEFTTDAAKLTDEYNFDTAVHSFGLHVALGLDAVHEDAGDGEFMDVVPGPVVTPTQAPTESQTEPPATEDNATEPPTEAPTEPPVVYGPHVLDIDFEALAESTSNSTIKSIHSYVASQTPTMENEYTGLFEGKNLILITAEAFTAEVIDPELTPTLYRLATEGIQFTDYYQPAWGASTTSGEFSNLMGFAPTTGGACMKEVTQQDLFLTMGRQLQNLDYFSVAYHNHSHTYYDRHLTHEKIGYDDFVAIGSGMTGVKGVWPESDLEMMQSTVTQYIDQQPFSVYYMSVSGHSVYYQSGNAMSRKNYHVVENLDYSDPVKCYLAANLEFEYAMEYLVNALEEAGIADDTVIVIATDHYPYGLEPSSTWGNNKDYLSELYGEKCNSVFVRDHNALIIWSGCLEDKDIVVDDPVFSLDILPTLSNLFGVDYDSRLLVGRDVFSEATPLVFWTDYSWKTDMGTYNASKGVFTPAEGVAVDDSYVEYISSVVKNKMTYSRSVNKNDYFNYVAKALKETT